MVSVGDYVQIGAPLLRLVDADPLKLRVPVTERRLGKVQKGQHVTVKIDAFPDTFAGEVVRVSPAVDTATRTFQVEILVPNSDRTLKPGSFATASIEVGRETALVLPKACIVTFAGLSKVVLVREGKVVEQVVELGDEVGEVVEINGGVTPDDSVVMSPSASLTTGTAVTVSAAAAGEKASTP